MLLSSIKYPKFT